MRLATLVLDGLATVQDGGRSGHEHWGVPMSGALHRERYETACSLLAGSARCGMPAIELLAGEVVIDGDVELDVAVVGTADVEVDGGRAACGVVLRGRETWVGRRGPGPVYIVIAGWQVPDVLGSAATDSFAGLGPAQLRDRDLLWGDHVCTQRVGMFVRAANEGIRPIRVVEAGSPLLSRFVAQGWRAESTARSGVRLMPTAPLPASGSTASAPVVPGAIQLTPSGEAIIVGPDGGVSGGYPVVGVIATADLDRASMVNVGDIVRFAAVSVREAIQLVSAPRVVLSPDQLS